MIRYATVLAAGLLLAACNTWSHAEVKPTTSGGAAVASQDQDTQTASLPPEVPKSEQTSPDSILLTKEDISDRKYKVLGDLKVTVNKTTLFHDDPTPAHIDKKLKEEAAKLGADAVILVRYGTVGISFFSWGSLDGQGRAVKFVK